MPIFYGDSTKNKKDIVENGVSMQKVFVGDRLVWQKQQAIKYGFLYNWYAATDSRIITSSDDWILPGQTQFNTLLTFLGGYSVAGGKLKEIGTSHWFDSNTGSTNEIGFNARGAGQRGSGYPADENYADFVNLKGQNVIHTSDSTDDFYSVSYRIECGVAYSSFDLYWDKKFGASIRLLYVGSGTPTEYLGNDGKHYRVVQIGGQTWLADYLAETKWRGGTWIKGYDGGVYTPISNSDWASLDTSALCAYEDDINNV